MSTPFDEDNNWESLHDRIVGLGEYSSKKSYYPELQKRLKQLETENERRKKVEEELHLQATILEEEIAERQIAEENASIERDNARAVFEAAPVGMIIISPDCSVIDANKAMSNLTDKSVEDIYGKVPGDVFDCAFVNHDTKSCGNSPECQLCLLKDKVKYVMSKRKPVYGFELNQLQRIKDGELKKRWLKISIEPIVYGAEQCAVIAVDDVTNLHEMEDEILRVRKLDSLAILAGGIAHDFNNLLTGILGNLSLAAAKSQNNSEILLPIERALQASERGADLTRQLLTFSKGGAPVKKLASISSIIKDSAEFALRGGKVALKTSIDENLWSAEVDIGQISQVINNLVINSVQAMPEGGSITISANNTTVEHDSGNLKIGSYIKINISDTGKGIPPEYIDKVFDPYFTTKAEGSGLGLASVYSIITKHSGYISISSKVDLGTDFTIMLPASEQKVEDNEKGSDSFTHGSGKILVMDDEEMIRDLAADMLDMLGYKVDTCKDGSEAVLLYKKAFENGEKFDVVIMDLTVPGGVGGEAAILSILKIDPEAVGIVASGYSNDPVMANYREYGFKAHIPKPFTLYQVSDTLENIMDKEKKAQL